MDVPKDIANSYNRFFTKDEGGKYFLAYIEELINSNHRAAEMSPEHARDNTQRAAGVREITTHISSVIASGGKKS